MHIGVDIGGTKTDAVVATATGEVLGRHRLPTGTGGPAAVAAATVAVAHACSEAGVTVADADSIGVGVPGAVQDGVVSHAMNLGIDRYDLGGALAAEWGAVPVVDNDVNAAALGAWVLGGERFDSMAFLNVGTGLAAGLILGGKLWRGSRNGAGEVGHVSIDPAGPPDADGELGTIETYASGSGIARQTGGLNAADVLADPAHEDVRRGLFLGVAAAVRTLVLTVDVEEVVLGGGLTAMGQPLLDGVRDVFAQWSARSRYLAALELGDRVIVIEPSQPVAAVGAAMVGSGRG